MVAPLNLRQTMSTIRLHYRNGAKWRAAPEMLGHYMAALTFIRESRLGVWERSLEQKNFLKAQRRESKRRAILGWL